MKGILAVNHFLKGEKFDTLHRHLISTAEAAEITLELKTNLELATAKAEADFVLFWDKDVNLARRLEKEGLPVFNSARAIMLCDDKAKTYNELLGIVPQPETLTAPLSFANDDMTDFVETAVEILGLPLVFKECCGSFGEQVFLCKSREEITGHISGKPFVLQKFIKESAGRDIRLEVVGNSVVAGMRRENKEDFRSNITNGGSARSCSPTEEECELALKASRALGLDFCGVDILEGGLVCEVNSNAHIINLMNATGTDIAPLIFEHIMRKIK
ncbi:MAG: RimK family alpha-L-glutamate ligase [Eubacterium sp.]|nr:RimK family alpha-L-glutamate ligase [Eubacterium sp.]